MAVGQIVFDGNSLTVGYGAHAGCDFPSFVHARSGSSFALTNLAVTGQNTQNMTADGVAQVDSRYDAGNAFNVLVAWEIRNDYIGNGLTATQAYNNYVTYCQARRAAGWQVIAVTMPPTTAYDKTANYDADRATINANIRANLGGFADGLADMAADSWIGGNLAPNDQAYYVNGVHLLDSGQAIMASIVQAALTTLLPGTFDFTHPGPAVDLTPREPVYSVLIGAAGAEPSEDITELVDLDTLHRSLSERGEASATIDIPVATENEVPSNLLKRDATIAVDVEGEREWLGQVVAVHKPQPQDLSYTLDCAGGWDTLHHCAPWCKGFVETRYDAVTEYPPSLLASRGWSPCTAIDVSTDGEILFTLPKGTTLKGNQTKLFYLQILGGMADGFSIDRIVCDVATSGTGVLDWSIIAADTNPFQPNHSTAIVASGLTNSASIARDTGPMSLGFPLITLWFQIYSGADVVAQTSDQTFQVRNIRAYIDRTTAPRVDEIVAAIDAEVRHGVPAASTEAIGAPLTAFMCDPFTTPADGIAVALTKAAVPPLCGIIQNQFVIKNRPTAPPDATRLWTVSEQLTPGLEWGVEIDEEQSVDYVGVAYNVIGDALLPDGTPQIAYYPTWPSDFVARTGLIDGGDLTAAEAAFYAQQGYYYLHNLAGGPVTIPYVVQDANGNERPADVIRNWDWVQNVGSLDAELAGPFLVSEVEHQGHIATLTIGAAEAYAYNGPDRMPTKGRYVGAHRVRSRTTTRVSFAKYWAWKHRKDKRKPKMPKRHAKYGTIRGYKWTDVESRYV